MYWSSPTKLTLNGVRRSLEVMSVKDIAIEDRRGISMNTQNTTAKGKANPHARIVRRRRRTLPEPSVFVFLVPRLMGSVSRSDGVGFGLQVLQALVNGDLSLVYLLEDAVGSRRSTCAQVDSAGGSHGVLQLVTERRELVVAGEHVLIPCLLRGGQVGGLLVPFDLPPRACLPTG